MLLPFLSTVLLAKLLVTTRYTVSPTEGEIGNVIVVEETLLKKYLLSFTAVNAISVATLVIGAPDTGTPLTKRLAALTAPATSSLN